MIKNIVVDECLSHHCADVLQGFIRLERPDFVVKHLKRDLGCGGVDDADWTKTLKPAREWLVVTSDYGSRSGGVPLTTAADQAGLSMLVLYRKLGDRPMVERLRSVLVMWPDIEAEVLPVKNCMRWRLKCRSAYGFELSLWAERHAQHMIQFRGAHQRIDKKRSRG